MATQDYNQYSPFDYREGQYLENNYKSGINVKANGVKGDARKANTGAAITSGTNTLTVTGASFTSTDQGKLIYVAGAGAAGAVLATTISTVTGATTVTLAANAGTTVTNNAWIYGTDDTAAIQALLNAMGDNTPCELYFPFGSYLVDTLYVKNNTVIRGQQSGAWAYEFYARTTRFISKPGLTGTATITDFNNTSVGNVNLRDFMIDGTKAFQTASKYGIKIVDSGISADSFWMLENVYVGFCKGTGLYLGALSRAARVNKCHFWQNDVFGAQVEGTDNSFIQTVFAQNGSNGIELNQGANHFYGCDIFSNIGHGANLAAFGRMNQFTNCFFDSNNKCGVYTVAKNTSLTQCRFATNSQEADGVYPDIDIVGGPSGCAIVNPTFYLVAGSTNLPHSAIRAVSNGSGNLVFVMGFSHDPSVTTWRSGSYVESSTGFMHKGFSFADGSTLYTGTTNGTKIGSASTDKIGFYGATAVVRPSATPANATDLATVITLSNDLKAKLISLGLIA